MSARILKSQELEQLAKEAGFQPPSLAWICGCSQRQLERKFQRELQTTPGRWLRELQCRLAIELVMEGCSNKEVAQLLHFANGFHFGREFKKIYGVSPQAYASLRGGKGKMSPLDIQMSLLDIHLPSQPERT
jgi:transcriptional regulator GlxA family with amidase domain